MLKLIYLPVRIHLTISFTRLINWFVIVSKLFFAVSFSRLQNRFNITLWQPVLQILYCILIACWNYFLQLVSPGLDTNQILYCGSLANIFFHSVLVGCKTNSISFQPVSLGLNSNQILYLGSLVKLFFFHSVLLGCQTDSVWFR